MDSEYTASPTLFYPAPKPDYFSSSSGASNQSPMSRWNQPDNFDFEAHNKAKRPTLSSNPSRKRSRDDIDHEELSTVDSASAVTPMETIEEPIYGPGMTLLNPTTGASISADSQSGTWLEEKEEQERLAEERRIEAARPILRASKSSRLDLTQAESPVAMASPAADIDPASAMLGVGWKVMNTTDEDMQKAVKGWARYVENHYPLNNVQIVSKSEGKEAFLVQSDEGYWLFKEDLDEGKLVSTTWAGCVAGLTSVPMVFEGEASLTAQKTPVANASGMDLD